MQIQNKYLKRLWEIKEGLIIGGAIGFLIGKYILPTQFDLNSIAQTQSALDFIKPLTSNIIEFAKQKIIIATTLVGALAGGFVDAMLPENFFWKRWFK